MPAAATRCAGGVPDLRGGIAGEGDGGRDCADGESARNAITNRGGLGVALNLVPEIHRRRRDAWHRVSLAVSFVYIGSPAKLLTGEVDHLAPIPISATAPSDE